MDDNLSMFIFIMLVLSVMFSVISIVSHFVKNDKELITIGGPIHKTKHSLIAEEDERDYLSYEFNRIMGLKKDNLHQGIVDKLSTSVGGKSYMVPGDEIQMVNDSNEVEVKLVFERDGNLVLYKYIQTNMTHDSSYGSPGGVQTTIPCLCPYPIWSSGTGGLTSFTDQMFLILYDDDHIEQQYPSTYGKWETTMRVVYGYNDETSGEMTWRNLWTPDIAHYNHTSDDIYELVLGDGMAEITTNHPDDVDKSDYVLWATNRITHYTQFGGHDSLSSPNGRWWFGPDWQFEDSRGDFVLIHRDKNLHRFKYLFGKLDDRPKPLYIDLAQDKEMIKRYGSFYVYSSVFAANGTEVESNPIATKGPDMGLIYSIELKNDGDIVFHFMPGSNKEPHVFYSPSKDSRT